MSFSFKKNFPSVSAYRKPIVDNDSGETLSAGKEYDILSNSEKLAAAGLQTSPSMDNGVQEASKSILDSFSISVLGQSNDAMINILSGDDLQDNESETLTDTTDQNPNVEKDKTVQLKTKKVSASKIFNQRTDNSINEADDCPPEQFKKREHQKITPPQAIDVSFDLFNESEQELLQIYGNNL